MTLIVLPVANEEFEAAKEWYDLQSAGLGKRYRELVKQTLAAILRNPLRYQSDSLGFHRAFVKVFPFKVYYKMDGDDIVVVAFAHNHRKPEYWLHR